MTARARRGGGGFPASNAVSPGHTAAVYAALRESPGVLQPASCEHIVISCRAWRCPFYMQDPDGSYIARWLPELAQLPKKWLHQPWLAPAGVLERAGVNFGDGPGCYPHRIVSTPLQVPVMPCPAHLPAMDWF
jgi:hypothetical protein